MISQTRANGADLRQRLADAIRHAALRIAAYHDVSEADLAIAMAHALGELVDSANQAERLTCAEANRHIRDLLQLVERTVRVTEARRTGLESAGRDVLAGFPAGL
jgi:hypothetical protein